MRMLIALHDPLDIDLTVQFAAQFACCAGQACTLLAVHAERRKASPAAQALDEAAQRLGVLQPHRRTAAGEAGRAILDELQRDHYDLLIMGDAPVGGEHGLRRLAHFSRQSIAAQVVEHAPCPVIVVKGLARPVRRILLCDSGSETSLLSRFTLQVAELLDGEEDVTVLHVMSQISAGPGVPGDELNADAQELIEHESPEGRLLEQDIRLLGQARIHPTPRVRHGLVIDEILAEAQQGDYDLVVIGAHREQGWQHLLLEDLAHELLARLYRPVLVVR